MKKKPSVLLVEDDDLFRGNTIATILIDAGYLVRGVANGQVARNLLQTDSFNVILSDVRMPVMDGLKLLTYAKERCKSRFILMTGFSEIIEAQKAYAAGADEFLNKPFRTEELLNAVESCCQTSFVSVGTQKVNLDVDYCKISIENFVSGSKLSADLFLRLSAYKYIKIANKNTTVPSERIHYYLEKGVSHLYMTKADFSRYVGLNIKLMTHMSEAADIATDRRLQFIKYNTDLMMQDIYINGISRDRYQDACDLVMNATHLLADCADTLKLLTILREVGDTYSHSLAVSVYATLIAKAHGWTSVSTLSKVAMAGLLHDVGQKELPLEVLTRPRFELKPDELKIMQAHTINGRDILASIRAFPRISPSPLFNTMKTAAGMDTRIGW